MNFHEVDIIAMTKESIMDKTSKNEGQIKDEIAEMIARFFSLQSGSIGEHDWSRLIEQIIDMIYPERK